MAVKNKLNSTDRYVISLQKTDNTQLELVGGKALNLGELSRIKGLRVPDGFSITTNAFQAVIYSNGEFVSLLNQLACIKTGNPGRIAELSKAIRTLIEGIAISTEVLTAIEKELSRFNENEAFAIRSSATAEDLPTASFAGQQDTYLNIIGFDEIIKHISKCWASLFTERAVTYRIQNNFDHRKVMLAVFIQQMVFPQAAGIMFTADPVNGDRRVTTIDAGFGLGEAMVSGIINSDNYKVADNRITEKTVPQKKLAIHALNGGGTKEVHIDAKQQNDQVLTDGQVLELSIIGKKIEEHFGTPQDIEWCLAENLYYVVQSRPITTLFPVPEVDDQEKHVYVSVGHQQMMTDAMKPLGLSFFLLTTPALMRTAGGRLFVDVTPMLGTSAGRHTLLNVLGKSDPIIKGALTTILERDSFLKPLAPTPAEPGQAPPQKPLTPLNYQTLKDYDPAIVYELIKASEVSIAALKAEIRSKSGTELFDFIVADMEQRKRSNSESQSFGVIMTGMNAAAWINEKMEEWLGEKNAADVITQSVDNNVTSEMGLELLNVADVIRPYPGVIDFLQQNHDDDDFLARLITLPGGPETVQAINTYLDKYGMRCAGEIDITRPRWSEKPATLIPLILSNIRNAEPGAAGKKFQQGKQGAMRKEADLISRLQRLPDGDQKAKETKRMIDLVRNFSGYREYPKYGIVSRYFIYKQALLKEAGLLVQAGIIQADEDVYYLSFEEFRKVVNTRQLDYHIINQRKAAYRVYQKLSPPRVMTSDGEIITAKYNRENLPADAIVGMPVSAGVIEGRARVILEMQQADLEEGDILVTTFTDPSWTPVFVAIKGLVTEVGGLMTHGAVIAREYGLPAVVGVEGATKLIRDGQRIRVNGTDGYVEIL